MVGQRHNPAIVRVRAELLHAAEGLRLELQHRGGLRAIEAVQLDPILAAEVAHDQQAQAVR